jgi:hypothetical protein
MTGWHLGRNLKRIWEALMARLSDYVVFNDDLIERRHKARSRSMAELHEAYLEGSLDISRLGRVLGRALRAGG